MKKNINCYYIKFLIPIIYAMLSGCLPTSKSITVFEYQSKKINNAKLIIALYTENIIIEYEGSVFYEFGAGDKNELILNHFKEMLLKELKQRSTFSSIKFVKYKNFPNYKTLSYKLNCLRNKEILVPDSGTIFQFSETVADFLLLFPSVKIYNRDTITVPYMQQSFSGPYREPLEKGEEIGYKAEFIFWDNRFGRVITYGYIDVISNTAARNVLPHKELWNQIDEKFIIALLEKTPFDASKTQEGETQKKSTIR